MPSCMLRSRCTRIARFSLAFAPVLLMLCFYAIYSRNNGGTVPRVVLRGDQATLGEENWELETPVYSENVSESCAAWESELNLFVSATPLIRLDPARLVYPGNMNGPSNELFALQEAIFIGITTNRTIVIPNFTPHATDEEKHFGDIIPAFMRVDTKHLSRLVSLTTLEDMRRRCNGRFDIGFQPRQATCHYRGYLRSTTNMTFNDASLSVEGQVLYGPKHKNCKPLPLGVRQTPFRMFPAEIKSVLKSDLPCALMINNYKNFRRKNERNIDESLIGQTLSDSSSIASLDPSQISSSTLLNLIEAFTRRPRYIREIAGQFVRDVMRAKKYITLHWRYNREWEGTYCRPGAYKVDFCERFHSTKPSTLAGVFVLMSKNLLNSTFQRQPTSSQSQCDSFYTVNAYMASATDNTEQVKLYVESEGFRMGFISRIYEREGAEKSGIFFNPKCWRLRLFNKLDLFTFIVNNYPREKCSKIWTDVHELVALVENELCHKSALFAYSEKSSWSQVAMQRSRSEAFPLWDLIDKAEATLQWG